MIQTWLYFQCQACLQTWSRSPSCSVSALWLVSPSPGAIRFSAVMYSCFVCVTVQVGGPVAWWIYTGNNHCSSSFWQEFNSPSLCDQHAQTEGNHITFSILGFSVRKLVKQEIFWVVDTANTTSFFCLCLPVSLMTHWTYDDIHHSVSQPEGQVQNKNT